MSCKIYLTQNYWEINVEIGFTGLLSSGWVNSFTGGHQEYIQIKLSEKAAIFLRSFIGQITHLTLHNSNFVYQSYGFKCRAQELGIQYFGYLYNNMIIDGQL